MADDVQRISVNLAGDDVPLLDESYEGSALFTAVFPEGASENGDGTITLTLHYPVTISFRAVGGPEVKQETKRELVMRRLTGADLRPVMAAKGGRGAQIALARSTGLSQAKIALLYARMDASDVAAANDVVSALMGVDQETGLPASAETAPDGTITLPLMFPVDADGIEPRHELIFRRLTGDDLIKILQAKEVLVKAMELATGQTPKDALALFDAMDAADVMAVNKVIGFLSGSGRKSGG